MDGLYVRPNDNFPFPIMDACFTNLECQKNRQCCEKEEFDDIHIDEKLFINVFLSQTNQMVSYIFDIENKEMIDKPFIISLSKKASMEKNFPIGTFFDDKRGKVYVVFRQGELVTVDIFKAKNQCRL